MSPAGNRPSNDCSYPRRVSSLRKMYGEARAVLDHQIHIAGDIDDKATRTVRITALLLGVVVSGASLVAEPYLYINKATVWGVLSFVLAIVLGTVTYSVSSPALGPGSRDIERVRENELREDEWLVVMLASYEDWIDRTERISRFNGILLGLSQSSMSVGLLLLSLGILERFEASISFASLSLYSLPVQLLVLLGVVWFLVFLVRTFRDARH